MDDNSIKEMIDNIRNSIGEAIKETFEQYGENGKKS